MDTEQVMALGDSLLNFSALGLKTVETLSGLEDDKQQRAWRDFQMRRGILDLNLEQTKMAQVTHIRQQVLDKVAEGMGGLRYGGDMKTAFDNYAGLRQMMAGNPAAREIVMGDPVVAQALQNFFAMGSGTYTNQDMSRLMMPDGAPLPNFEMLMTNAGKPEGLKQAMLIADRMPQYAQVAMPDGTKKTIDQREQFYRQWGYKPEMIMYDRALGRPGVVRPEDGAKSYEIDMAEAEKRVRANLWSVDHPGTTFYDGYTAVSLAEAERSVAFGGKTMKWDEVVPEMRRGNAGMISAFLSGSNNLQADVERLRGANIPVTDAMVQQAQTSKALAVQMGSTAFPVKMGDTEVIVPRGTTAESQATSDAILRNPSLDIYGEGAAGVRSAVMADAQLIPDGQGGVKPVINPNSPTARLVARQLSGESYGQIISSVVGAKTFDAVRPDLERVIFGADDTKKGGKTTEIGAARVSAGISALNEALPGMEKVLADNPEFAERIATSKSQKEREFYVGLAVQKAVNQTWTDASLMAATASKAVQAGAAQAGMPLRAFAERLGSGDQVAVDAMRRATVDGQPADAVFRQAYDRATGDYVAKVEKYQNGQMAQLAADIRGLEPAAKVMEPDSFVMKAAFDPARLDVAKAEAAGAWEALKSRGVVGVPEAVWKGNKAQFYAALSAYQNTGSLARSGLSKLGVGGLRLLGQVLFGSEGLDLSSPESVALEQERLRREQQKAEDMRTARGEA